MVLQTMTPPYRNSICVSKSNWHTATHNATTVQQWHYNSWHCNGKTATIENRPLVACCALIILQSFDCQFFFSAHPDHAQQSSRRI